MWNSVVPWCWGRTSLLQVPRDDIGTKALPGVYLAPWKAATNPLPLKPSSKGNLCVRVSEGSFCWPDEPLVLKNLGSSLSSREQLCSSFQIQYLIKYKLILFLSPTPQNWVKSRGWKTLSFSFLCFFWLFLGFFLSAESSPCVIRVLCSKAGGMVLCWPPYRAAESDCLDWVSHFVPLKWNLNDMQSLFGRGLACDLYFSSEACGNKKKHHLSYVLKSCTDHRLKLMPSCLFRRVLFIWKVSVV